MLYQHPILVYTNIGYDIWCDIIYNIIIVVNISGLWFVTQVKKLVQSLKHIQPLRKKSSILNDLNAKIKTYSWSFDTKFGTPNATNIAKPKCFYNTYDTTYHYRKQNKYLTDLTIVTYAGCTAKANPHYDTIHEMWARFVPSNYQGCKDLTIDFADSSTSHYKKSIALWEWDFGDGTPLVSSTSKTTPSHTYKNEGIYYATLKIYDNLNKSIACKDTS